MFHYPRWKIIAILGSVLIALLIALPNVLPTASKQFMADHFGLRPLTLGLDLQGGSNILMEVDQKDLITNLKQQLLGDIRTTLSEPSRAFSTVISIKLRMVLSSFSKIPMMLSVRRQNLTSFSNLWILASFHPVRALIFIA